MAIVLESMFTVGLVALAFFRYLLIRTRWKAELMAQAEARVQLHPDSSYKEMLVEFRFAKGTLSFHLKKLLDANIVSKTKRERETIYRIKDEKTISQMIITYQSGIVDETVNGFIDIWTKIS